MTTLEAAKWYCVWCWAVEACQDAELIDGVINCWPGEAFEWAYDALTEAGFWRTCPTHGYQAIDRALRILEGKP